MFPGVSLPAISPNKGEIRSERSRVRVEEIRQSKSRFRLNVVYLKGTGFQRNVQEDFPYGTRHVESLQTGRLNEERRQQWVGCLNLFSQPCPK